MKQPLDLKAFLENKLGQITPTEEAKTAITNAEQTIPKNLMLDAESSEFKPETTPVVLDTSSSPSVEQAKLFDDEMNRFIDNINATKSKEQQLWNSTSLVLPRCRKQTLTL